VSTSESIAADIQHGDPASRSWQFWFSRLGSLLAVAPLGVWTVNHIWDNLAAFGGAEAWQRQVTYHPNPGTHAVVLLLVLLPLVLHTVWGIRRLFSFRSNNLTYRNFGNLKYLLQRLSAVGALLFLGAHIWLAFLYPRLVLGHAEEFSDIAREMRWHLPTLMVYLLGTMGVSYHLANGLWSFSMGWGLTVGRKSLSRMNTLAIAFFVILLVGSWSAIFALWSAGSAFPPGAQQP
jgi:succinate dehydrogenase / fumarate reductase cytochrome b subunit